MASVIEYILGVSGSVLLVAWVALLAGAVFWRPASTLDRPEWLAARCRTGAPTGLALTAAVLTLATSAWSLALVTFSVVHHTGLARHDPRVLTFVTGHQPQTPPPVSVKRPAEALQGGIVSGRCGASGRRPRCAPSTPRM
jgi:hypothetical protein